MCCSSAVITSYEGDSPTRPVKEPEWEARLDYLYKWYLWCWAYRDLTRDIPSVTIPDDHDIYQGNIWGAGGRKTDVDNKGGYVMPADWVRMVERTQTVTCPIHMIPHQSIRASVSTTAL